MKSKRKTTGFINNFKYFMLLPIILIIVSIVFGAVFGFNLDYDFRDVTTFNVKFNTTVTEAEYKVLEKEVYRFVNEKSDNFRVERIGENAQNGLIVSIADIDSDSAVIRDLKVQIEDNLLKDVNNDIESLVKISTTDTIVNLSYNAFDLILYSSLILLGIMIIAFIYTFIRYNLISAISLVLSILFNVTTLTAVYLVARIPLNSYFILSYFVMTLSSIIMITTINNIIKNNLNIEKFAKYSNAERVYNALNETYKWQVAAMASIIVVLLGIMLFGSVSLLYTILGIISGIIIAMLTSIFIYGSLWSFWYKKDKDTMLRRRIEKENNKSKEDNEEKIVV